MYLKILPWYLLGVLVLGGMSGAVAGLSVEHGRTASTTAFAICLGGTCVASIFILAIRSARLIARDPKRGTYGYLGIFTVLCFALVLGVGGLLASRELLLWYTHTAHSSTTSLPSRGCRSVLRELPTI
jgi:heme A synthase